jgi:hypothetical protein
MNAYKRGVGWQLMAKIRDTCDMYDMFKAALISRGMKPTWDGGKWPSAPEAGSTHAVYQLVDFPGVRIQQSVGVYLHAVSQIVLLMPAVSGQALPCIEFCASDRYVQYSVAASNVADMLEALNKVIVCTPPAVARPWYGVAVKPVDWADLLRRVCMVVDAFDVGRDGEEAAKSKADLLELIRSFLDVLIQKSDARRSAGGGG